MKWDPCPATAYQLWGEMPLPELLGKRASWSLLCGPFVCRTEHDPSLKHPRQQRCSTLYVSSSLTSTFQDFRYQPPNKFCWQHAIQRHGRRTCERKGISNGWSIPIDLRSSRLESFLSKVWLSAGKNTETNVFPFPPWNVIFKSWNFLFEGLLNQNFSWCMPWFIVGWIDSISMSGWQRLISEEMVKIWQSSKGKQFPIDTERSWLCVGRCFHVVSNWSANWFLLQPPLERTVAKNNSRWSCDQNFIFYLVQV